MLLISEMLMKKSNLTVDIQISITNFKKYFGVNNIFFSDEIISFIHSDKQKSADEKNIARINREIDRTATMLHQTMDEHHRISTINHHIK